METITKTPLRFRTLSEEERKTLKPFPVFKTDKEAEDFVDNADLTEYDFSDFKIRSMESVIANFEKNLERQKKQKRMYMRLPEVLFGALKAKAQEMGMPYSKYVRTVLEDSLAKG